MKLKRVISILLSLMVIASIPNTGLFDLNPFTLNASAVTSGDYTYSISDGKIRITGFDGAGYNGCLTIPKEIDGYPVDEISKGAFRNCSLITELIIPDSVTKISTRAFKSFTSLEKLTVPFIGESRDSKGPFSVLGAFFEFDTFSQSNSPSTVYSTDFYNEKYGTFEGATWQYTCRNSYYGLDSYNDKLYTYNSYHYYIPESLNTVVITDSVSIPSAAFYNCTNITSIDVNNEVSSAGKYAFAGTGIISFVLPESITYVPSYMFYNCDSLENIIFSGNIKRLDEWSFASCNNLKKIILPDKLTEIGDLAFAGCTELEDVSLPKSLITICENAFLNCSGIKQLVVPNSVKTIEAEAFKGMNNLASLTIPFVGESRDSLGYKDVLGIVFGYESVSSKLTPSIIFSSEFYNVQYGTVDGAVWQYTSHSLSAGVQKYDDGSYDILYRYGSYFYYIPNSLTKVVVTSDTSINSAAFMNCSNIKTLILNDEITNISDYSFKNMNSLEYINISDNVSSIGNNSFENCSNVTVFGYNDSYAESYCASKTIPFVAYEDISSIIVSKLPENSQYPGKLVDITGMEVTVTLNDGTNVVIKDGFNVAPAFVPGGGDQTVTVVFCNYETTFKINAINVNGISILTSPTKVNYIVGDNLDLSGLTLRVYYSDGVTATATEGFTTNIEMLEKSGNILVPINYYGKSTNLKVSVIPLEVTVLEIESSPVKTEYYVGDEIDTNGLVLKATYNNGKTESVTDGFEVKTVLDSSDIVEVVVEYSGKTISYPVKVNAVVSTGWTLATEPSKLKYSIGEKIDTTGLTLSEFFNNGSVTTVTEGFTCTPETFTESGEQIVTVEYKGSAAMFVVNIHDEGDWLYSGNNIFEKKCNICGDVLESKSVYLTLDYETLEIFNQSNNTINAIVTDNFDCEVNFESSDTSILAVDENGNITAKSVGEATITATIKDTDIVETCYVTVLPRAYTITWIVDDKIIEEVINEGSEILTPEDPEKIGYTFNGWTPEVPGTMSSDNLTFTATFTANNYDAVFYANGGSWADGKTEKIVSTPYNSEIIIPDTPTRKGYVFVSWAPEVGVMDNINGKKFVAQWSYAEDTPYVVETYTMNTSGEYDKTVENLVGITNSTITVSPVINDGFVLDNEKSIISGKVTADGSLVLKVYINRKSYTLTTISSDTSTQKTYLFGAEVIQPDTPVKEGYKFLGWDSEYPEKMPAKNIVINALWDANSYSAIFEANNGTWTDNSDKKTFSVKYDSEIIAPEIPVRQGYIFSGWIYDGQNLGTNLGIMDNVTGKIFTACWIASTDTIYTVETYTMDVKGEYVKSVQTLSGTTNEVATVTPVVSEGFKLNAETSILDGIISADNSLVLKVYIDRNVYTITEKVDETEVNKTYYYGSPVSVITSPSKTGHTFVGWDNEIPSTMPAQNIVLTAVFTVNKYEANFDANGGKWSDGKTVKVISTDYNNKIIVPESPSREGYIFSGWSPEVGLMDDVNGKNFVAVWTASTDTVYTVEIYLMNTSGEYEKSSQTYTGTTGEVATAEIDVSTGFSLNAEKSIIGGIIKADNSLVLKVYIDRNTYILTTVVDDASTQTAYLYGSIISEPVTPLKDGYKFISWDKSIPETMPAENIVLTAIFKKLYICPYCGKEILGEDAIKEHIASETKVTINGGTLINGDLKPGATITIKAEQIDGKIFSHWIVEGATVEDANSTETTIVLGSGKISITAVYNDCDCKCHQGGIAGFFFKITLFFQKLFGKNLECICGAKH